MALLAVVAVLALAPATVAATPEQEGYNAPGGSPQADIQTPGARTPATTSARAESSRFLPFTGQDLAYFVGVGGGLLLLGFGLRHLSGRNGRPLG